MEQLQYNKNTLDIIKSLSCLSKSLIIEKSEDQQNIIINSGDVGSMILYQLVAPINHFSFLGEMCAFYEYPDFHDLVSILEKCEIYQKEDTLVLVSGNTKIKYLTSEPELISNTYEAIEYEDTVAAFDIDHTYLKKINKLKSSIRATSIRIDIHKNEITFKFFNKNSENTYEDKFTNNVDNLEDFSFLASTEVFDKIPIANYYFEISSDGLFKFNMMCDDIKLHIITGEMEEDV